MKTNKMPKGWLLIRKAILERDCYRCRICECDHNQLHVHHIDYYRTHNDESNLVTICQECHRLVHAEQYKPSEHPDWPAPWVEQQP